MSLKNDRCQTVRCPPGRFHRSALITQQLPASDGSQAQSGGAKTFDGAVVSSRGSSAWVKSSGTALMSLHNRSERSFTGRKARQEAAVAPKFQGSKNKMGAWIPSGLVDGERWWRAQQHASTDQNYSWAAGGSRRLLLISTNGCKTTHRKRFPSSDNLKLVLEPHRPSPAACFVDLFEFCM